MCKALRRAASRASAPGAVGLTSTAAAVGARPGSRGLLPRVSSVGSGLAPSRPSTVAVTASIGVGGVGPNGVAGDRVSAAAAANGGAPPGRAAQVNPIKPTLKAPGTKRFNLKYDCFQMLLSNSSCAATTRAPRLHGGHAAPRTQPRQRHRRSYGRLRRRGQDFLETARHILDTCVMNPSSLE